MLICLVRLDIGAPAWRSFSVVPGGLPAGACQCCDASEGLVGSLSGGLGRVTVCQPGSMSQPATPSTATPSGRAQAPTVVVVGGGISGLTAAWALVQRRPDCRVLVLEGAPGRRWQAGLVDVGGLTVDAGAEALLARRPEALDLATEVGLGADLVSPATTSAGVWSRGAGGTAAAPGR